MRHKEVIEVAFSRFQSLAELNSPEFHLNDEEAGFRAFIRDFNGLFSTDEVDKLINENVGPSILRMIATLTDADVDSFIEREPFMHSIWVTVAANVGMIAFFVGMLSQQVMDEDKNETLSKFNELIGDNNARDKEEG